VDEGAFREERRTTQLAMFVPPISNKPRERSEHLAPAASCVQEELVNPTCGRRDSATQRVSPDPTKTAATNEHRSERSEQSNTAPVRRAPDSRCASVGGRAEECRSGTRNGLATGRTEETV